MTGELRGGVEEDEGSEWPDYNAEFDAEFISQSPHHPDSPTQQGSDQDDVHETFTPVPGTSQPGDASHQPQPQLHPFPTTTTQTIDPSQMPLPPSPTDASQTPLPPSPPLCAQPQPAAVLGLNSTTAPAEWDNLSPLHFAPAVPEAQSLTGTCAGAGSSGSGGGPSASSSASPSQMPNTTTTMSNTQALTTPIVSLTTAIAAFGYGTTADGPSISTTASSFSAALTTTTTTAAVHASGSTTTATVAASSTFLGAGARSTFDQAKRRQLIPDVDMEFEDKTPITVNRHNNRRSILSSTGQRKNNSDSVPYPIRRLQHQEQPQAQQQQQQQQQQPEQQQFPHPQQPQVQQQHLRQEQLLQPTNQPIATVPQPLLPAHQVLPGPGTGTFAPPPPPVSKMRPLTSNQDLNLNLGNSSSFSQQPAAAPASGLFGAPSVASAMVPAHAAPSAWAMTALVTAAPAPSTAFASASVVSTFSASPAPNLAPNLAPTPASTPVAPASGWNLPSFGATATPAPVRHLQSNMTLTIPGFSQFAAAGHIGAPPTASASTGPTPAAPSALSSFPTATATVSSSVPPMASTWARSLIAATTSATPAATLQSNINLSTPILPVAPTAPAAIAQLNFRGGRALPLQWGANSTTLSRDADGDIDMDSDSVTTATTTNTTTTTVTTPFISSSSIASGSVSSSASGSGSGLLLVSGSSGKKMRRTGNATFSSTMGPLLSTLPRTGAMLPPFQTATTPAASASTTALVPILFNTITAPAALSFVNTTPIGTSFNILASAPTVASTFNAALNDSFLHNLNLHSGRSSSFGTYSSYRTNIGHSYLISNSSDHNCTDDGDDPLPTTRPSIITSYDYV
ncbi:hypothetical protein BGX24_009111 [Mortierella sp. AD032]|nr:hypothetical protein BGX24_009111 [Mortierella sp. AD032]